MSTIVAPTPTSPARRPVAPTVRRCYDVLSLCPQVGIEDFTDGKYVDDRNDRQAYLAAQQRQAECLLDQIHCRQGQRILDVGCGYGRILAAAESRGAEAVGITISPQQVAECRRRGLHVELQNYCDLLSGVDRQHWESSFDGVIANGSLEHFVQPEDAANGKADEIYTEMFDVFRRVLRNDGRLATTAIHRLHDGQVRPADVLARPECFPKNSANYHAANVQRSFGGWLPYPGQLERCAAGRFELVAEEDGTADYLLTSEYWVRRARRSLVGPHGWMAAGGGLVAHPRATWRMLKCMLWDESWTYQFRPPAPTSLRRQTWVAV
jgi:cyclopropane-fatty-acyl-phospholipid synthase